MYLTPYRRNAVGGTFAGVYVVWQRLPVYVRRSLLREAQERGQQLQHFIEVNAARIRAIYDRTRSESVTRSEPSNSNGAARRLEPEFDRMGDPMDISTRPSFSSKTGIRGAQHTSKSSRSYGGRGVSLMSRVKAELALTKRYNIFRWQSFGQYDAGTGVNLLRTGGNALTTPTGVVWPSTTFSFTMMPMFVFNTTCKPFGTIANALSAGGACGTLPFYQLCRVWLPNAVPSYAQYLWLPVPGQANAPSGNPTSDYNYNWSVEDFNSGTAADNDASSSQIHEWSDLNLIVYGAKQRQNTVHMNLVKFHDNDVAPPRLIFNTTDAAGTQITAGNVFNNTLNGSSLYSFDQGLNAGDKLPLGNVFFGGTGLLPYDDEKVQKNVAAFDSFWARKIGHPLRSSKTTFSDCGFHTMQRRSVTLGSLNSTDEDKIPYQHHEKIFVRGGQLRDLRSAYAVNNNTVTVATADGVRNTHAYNSINRTVTSNIVQDVTKDIWCMIYCMDHDVVEPAGDVTNPPPFLSAAGLSGGFYQTGPGYAGGTTPADFHPSFDIMCRAKFSSTL